MYTRSMYKRIRSILGNTIASIGTTAAFNSSSLNSTSLCSITGWTTRPFGNNFTMTLYCSTGSVYVVPESTVEPTSTNAFLLEEGESIDLKVSNFLSVKGSSTTAAFQAIVWEN